MSKQKWRVKFEEFQAAHGDDGLSDVADHLPSMIRVANKMRDVEFRNALEYFLIQSSQKRAAQYSPLNFRKHLVVPACDGSQSFLKPQDCNFEIQYGKETLVQLKNRIWNGPTKEMEVSLYCVQGPTNHFQMFNELEVGFIKLVLTQHQVIEFCIKHEFELLPGSNQFLLASEYGYLVANVNRVTYREFRVVLHRLGDTENGLMIYRPNRFMLVVPHI